MTYSSLATACIDEHNLFKIKTSIQQVQDLLFEIDDFRRGNDEPSTGVWITDRKSHPEVFSRARCTVSKRHAKSLEEQAMASEYGINEVIAMRYQEVMVEFYNILGRQRESDYEELSKIKKMHLIKRSKDRATRREKKRRFWDRKRISISP